MATQAEIADHLGVKERQIRRLLKSGVLPPSRGVGGCSIDACRIAYINYLRGVATGQVNDAESDSDRPEAVAIDLNEARALNLQANTRLAEIKERQLMRELAPISDIKLLVAKMGEQISAILGQIPTKIRRRNPSLSNSEIEAIKREVIKAQNIAAKAGDDFGDHI